MKNQECPPQNPVPPEGYDAGAALERPTRKVVERKSRELLAALNDRFGGAENEDIPEILREAVERVSEQAKKNPLSRSYARILDALSDPSRAEEALGLGARFTGFGEADVEQGGKSNQESLSPERKRLQTAYIDALDAVRAHWEKNGGGRTDVVEAIDRLRDVIAEGIEIGSLQGVDQKKAYAKLHAIARFPGSAVNILELGSPQTEGDRTRTARERIEREKEKERSGRNNMERGMPQSNFIEGESGFTLATMIAYLEDSLERMDGAPPKLRENIHLLIEKLKDFQSVHGHEDTADLDNSNALWTALRRTYSRLRTKIQTMSENSAERVFEIPEDPRDAIAAIERNRDALLADIEENSLNPDDERIRSSWERFEQKSQALQNLFLEVSMVLSRGDGDSEYFDSAQKEIDDRKMELNGLAQKLRQEIEMASPSWSSPSERTVNWLLTSKRIPRRIRKTFARFLTRFSLRSMPTTRIPEDIPSAFTDGQYIVEKDGERLADIIVRLPEVRKLSGWRRETAVRDTVAATNEAPEEYGLRKRLFGFGHTLKPGDTIDVAKIRRLMVDPKQYEIGGRSILENAYSPENIKE